MSAISTHILDTSQGRPAAGVGVTLHAANTLLGANTLLAAAATDADGRCQLREDLGPGDYRLTFATGAYFAARNQVTLYPEIAITFTVLAGEDRYHVPLLLNPFGYSTYRGT